MRARVLLVALLTVLVGGCSAGDGPPQQPAGQGAGPTTPTPSTDEDADADRAEPAEDPLRFSGGGGLTSISCFPEGERDLVWFDRLRPRRPVTLSGVTGGGPAMEIGRAWVAPQAPGSIDSTGVLDVDARGTAVDDVEAWAARQPLPGAEVEPGTTYTFFVRATVRPDRRLDDFLLGWDDGTSTGESTFEVVGRTRSGGC